MQILRTRVRVLLFYFFNQLIKLPCGIFVFNKVYENSGPTLVHILNTHIKLPNRSAIWKIKLNNGEVVKTKLIKDKPITRHVAMGYRWHDSSINRIESIIVDHFASHYKTTSFYIDAGSNMGMRSMCALSKHLNVIMIEPNKETNDINIGRCLLNNYSNYTLHELGISNEDTTKTIYFDKTSYLSSLDENVANQDGITITNEMIINVNRLDTLLGNKLNQQNHFFIKIDIEGHEIEALEGCSELLKEPNITFLIEIVSKGRHIERIFKLMWGLGFRIFEKIPLSKKDIFLREKFENNHDHNFIEDDFLFIRSKEIIDIFQKHME